MLTPIGRQHSQIFLDSNRVGPILVHTAYSTSSHSSVLNLLNLYSNFTF